MKPFVLRGYLDQLVAEGVDILPEQRVLLLFLLDMTVQRVEWQTCRSKLMVLLLEGFEGLLELEQLPLEGLKVPCLLGLKALHCAVGLD